MASIRSTGTQVTSATNVPATANLTPGLPATRVNGDLLLLYATCKAPAVAVPATPSGWTPLVNVSGTYGRIILFGRAVDGTESGPTVTWTGLTTGTTSGTPVSAQIACVEGIDLSGGVASSLHLTGAVSNQAASTTICAAGAAITTTIPNAIVFAIATRQAGVGTFATLAVSDTITWAKVAATFHSASGTDVQQEWQWGQRAAAGSVAAKTFTISSGGTNFGSTGVQVAFKPFVAAPTATPVARVSLASGSTPDARTNHSIKVRARKASGTGTVNLNVALYEGSTNRSGDLSTLLTTTLTDYSLPIPDASAANITDYSNLEIRFWANSPTGDAVNIEIARIALSAPTGAFVPTTYYGSSSLATTFGSTTQGKRRTTSAIAMPVTVAKAVAGQRKTFSVTATPIGFGAVTAGQASTPAPPGAYYDEVIADNPISYWRLGGGLTVHDEKGVAPDVTATGGATVPGLLTNDANTALNFDGVDDEAQTGTITPYNITQGTIEAWIKTPDAGTGHRCLLSKEYAYGMFLFNNELQAYDWGPGGGQRATSVNLNDNARHHVVQTFQSGVAGGSQFYVDGVPAGPPFQMTVSSTTYTLSIANNGINAQRFTGIIDEVAVYGSVLTPAQITKHYQAGLTGAAPEPTTHYGSTSLATNFAATSTGVRKTFGVVARPSTFGAVTQARRTTKGVTATSLGFSAVTQAQRKTFGVVARPTSFAAITAGQGTTPAVTHYGATSTSVAVGIATQGSRKTFGAVARPATFGAVTQAQRKTFSTVAQPTSFAAVTQGRRRTTGQVALPVSFTKDVQGQRKAFSGVIGIPATFSAAISARRKTFGAVTAPFAFSATSTALRKAFGSTATPLSFGAVTAGKATTPTEFQDPSDLTGLAIWFDASKLALANGAAVDPWPNLANGSVPGAITGTPAPKLKTNAKNGLPAVQFTANEGRVRINGTTGVHANWTVSYVARMVGPNAGRIVNGIYPPTNLLVGWWNGNQDAMYDNGFASNTYTPWTTDWKLYSGDGVPGLSRLFSDGTLLGSTTTGQGWNNTLSISGYDPNGAQETCDCEVAEVVIYDRQLSEVERQQIEGYLREKWIAAPAVTTHYGSTSMSVGFDAATAGQRKAFGQVAQPTSFSATTAAKRTTFGQVARPASFGAVVAGQRKTFSALAHSTAFSATTQGRRKAFGSTVTPVTFAAVTQGKRVAVGNYGMSSLTVGFGATTAGRKKTFGLVARPVGFTAVTSARRRTFGVVARPTNFGAIINGRRKTFGIVARPTSLLIVTSGIRIAGKVTYYGVVALSLSLTRVTQGHKTTFSRLSLPLTFHSFTSHERTATVLNEATAIYLGETPVEAIYAGSQRVWVSERAMVMS